MRSLFAKLIFLVLMTQVVFSATTLTSGVSKSGSVSQGSWKYYKISASSGSTVTVTLTGLSNDVDLYIKKGSQPTRNNNDTYSYEYGTTSESATLTISSSTTVYIGVYGYESGSFTVKATTNGGSSSGGSSSGSSGGSNSGGNSSSSEITLSSGVSKSGSVSQGSWKYYKISASSGSTVTVSMTGLSSDVDLYVKKGSQPTQSSYDERPYDGGRTSESATVTVSSSTTVYIGINGYTSGSFTIKATVSGGSSSGDNLTSGAGSLDSVDTNNNFTLAEKRLNVTAINQEDYDFRINGKDFTVAGCVPSTYAMMFDYYVRYRGYNPVSINYSIQSLLKIYDDLGIASISDSGVGVFIQDNRFVEKLTYGHITFNNCQTQLGYSISLNRQNANGWSYNTFMEKVSQNIMEDKPIAISVVVLRKTSITSGISDFSINNYKYAGGHHMLIVGYDGGNKLYANDTWSNSFSTWERIEDIADYDYFDGNDNLIDLNTANSINSNLINRNIIFKKGNDIIILKTHDSSFNTPIDINWYDSVSGCYV